jgi:MOSC domain-containing protein YiiM
LDTLHDLRKSGYNPRMENHDTIRIIAQFVGGPKKLPSDDGEWVSAIGRTAVDGPIPLSLRGLEGDSVADTEVHGTADQAVCCHSAAHYHFWNEAFRLTGTPQELFYGALGENWTLSNCDETTICIGDAFKVGTARVQVSQPRTPCWKQEAKTGLKELILQTIETLKTGFYLRVLESGSVAAGDTLALLDRPHPDISIASLCDFKFHGRNPDLIRTAIQTNELSENWKVSLAKKLAYL